MGKMFGTNMFESVEKVSGESQCESILELKRTLNKTKPLEEVSGSVRVPVQWIDT